MNHTNQTKPEIRIIESWTGGYTVEIGRKTHPGQEAPWVPEARFEGYTLESAEATALFDAEAYGIDYIGCYDRFEQPVKRSVINERQGI